jgi:hypothetical protein
MVVEDCSSNHIMQREEVTHKPAVGALSIAPRQLATYWDNFFFECP